MPRNRKKSKSIDVFDVDMTALFGDLIRERHLYRVLESLAQACSARAEHFRKKIGHPAVQVMQDAEADFYDELEFHLLELRVSIDSKWGDRAPCSADGDIERTMDRVKEMEWKYLRDLAATLKDPSTTATEWRKAAVVLAKEGEGMIWIDRETGKPSAKQADAFRAYTAELANPDIPEQQRREMAEDLDEFLNM